MELKDHVIRSCRYLLLPVVRFLLRHGVTWSEFGELAKDAYVRVARDEYGIQGRPTNNSRVAMLTGLSRREVARVRERVLENENSGDTEQGNQISRILTGWHIDPEFTDANGRPKDLPATGPKGSLSGLLKRYAGDLPHGAIRKEMQQRGLIEELIDGQFRVLRRDFVYSELDPEIVRRMGVALHDHAATLDHNLNEDRQSAPRFEAIAENRKLAPKMGQAFQELVETRGLAFLEEMDSWLSQHESSNKMDTSKRTSRLGVGVYLIYDESEQGRTT
ncbi:MAG: DUF6502 family protein [Gammaproteobacteria bacterium]|nr:DUF6502 family protein [Gammaproteobacteria bacterium]